MLSPEGAGDAVVEDVERMEGSGAAAVVVVPRRDFEEFGRKLVEHCDVLGRTTAAINEAAKRRLDEPPEVLSLDQRGDDHVELDLAGTSALIEEQLATSRDPADRHRLAEYKQAIAGEQGPGERGPKARGVRHLLARDLAGLFDALHAELTTWVEHSRPDVVIVALTEKMRAEKMRAEKAERERIFTGTNELFPDLTPRDVAYRVVAEWFHIGWDRMRRIIRASGSG